jgi:hypothetical protein
MVASAVVLETLNNVANPEPTTSSAAAGLVVPIPTLPVKYESPVPCTAIVPAKVEAAFVIVN